MALVFKATLIDIKLLISGAGLALVFRATLIEIKLLFKVRDGAGFQGHSD